MLPQWSAFPGLLQTERGSEKVSSSFSRGGGMDANPGGPIDLCRWPLVYGSARTPRSADHLRRFVPAPHFDPQAAAPLGPTAGLRLPRAAIALRPGPGLRKRPLLQVRGLRPLPAGGSLAPRSFAKPGTHSTSPRPLLAASTPISTGLLSPHTGSGVHPPIPARGNLMAGYPGCPKQLQDSPWPLPDEPPPQ